MNPLLGKRIGRWYVGRCTRTHHLALLRSGKGTYCVWHRFRHPSIPVPKTQAHSAHQEDTNAPVPPPT